MVVLSAVLWFVIVISGTRTKLDEALPVSLPVRLNLVAALQFNITFNVMYRICKKKKICLECCNSHLLKITHTNHWPWNKFDPRMECFPDQVHQSQNSFIHSLTQSHILFFCVQSLHLLDARFVCNCFANKDGLSITNTELGWTVRANYRIRYVYQIRHRYSCTRSSNIFFCFTVFSF